MELYSKNLKFFEQYLRSIHEIITSETSIFPSKIEILGDENNVFVSNNNSKCYLHSVYNVDTEIDRMFSEIDKNSERIIIFGLGLGYGIDYIYNNFPKLKRIIIIEPDLNVFKETLNFVNMEEMLVKLKNVTLIINKSPEEAFNILWASLKERIMEKVELVYNISYRTLYEGYFEKISNYLKEYIQNTLIATATDDAFSKSWITNVFKNLKFNGIPIEIFFYRINRVPAIIVSAGPSLNQNIQYLKDIKDRALIIAVGSAIKILDTHGITPHFRFAFDGNLTEKKVFEEIDTEACPLIYGSELYNEILPEYKGQKIKFILDLDFISRYIHKELGEENHLIASGFSVANVALDAVIKMGFTKVIFMGQDLSYTNGQLYAKGSALGNKDIDFKDEMYIRTNDMNGNEVYTTKQFMGMKNLFESIIEKSNNVEFINATAEGLHIKGTVDKRIEDVINEDLLNEFNLTKEIKSIADNFSNESNGNKIKKILSTLLIEVNELIDNNNERLKKLKKINRYIEKDIKNEKVAMELEYINIFEEKLKESSFYLEVILPLLNTKFTSIAAVNYYDGQDKKEKILSTHKSILGKTVELRTYLNLIKQLVEENLDL